MKICKKLGIKIVDGLGEKIQSSSQLIEHKNLKESLNRYQSAKKVLKKK